MKAFFSSSTAKQVYCLFSLLFLFADAKVHYHEFVVCSLSPQSFGFWRNRGVMPILIHGVYETASGNTSVQVVQNSQHCNGEWTASWTDLGGEQRGYLSDQGCESSSIQRYHSLVSVYIYIHECMLADKLTTIFSTWHFLLLLYGPNSKRHGVRQRRTAWADGPEFITQCPIRPGGSYTYRFTIQDQEGTLWWHAHSSWLRASVYGALIIRPREGESYPFPKPKVETPILIGNLPPYSLICRQN